MAEKARREEEARNIKQQMAEYVRIEEEARAAALEVEAGRADQEKAAAADAAHQVNIGHARTRSEKTVALQRARASRAQASTETCGPHAVGPADEALDEDKSDSESAEDGNEGENQDEEKNEEENVAEERGVQLSDNDAVAETIVNFNLESPKNVSSVYQSVRGNTGVISATTGHVRSMVHNFPEVLQMNCTPKTNKYNYQLLSMIVMDQYGNCQPVQYSLLETNGDWHMAKRLERFKRANEHWCFVRIVIVDKDMRGVGVLRQKLPEASILLCHFHVIKWLHDTIRMSNKHGAYEADVLAQTKSTQSRI